MNTTSQSPYMLGKVNRNFLKNQMKFFHTVDINDIPKRKNIYKNRNKEFILEEYQNLYDYYNFLDINTGKFELGYNDIGAYKFMITDWIFYLMMCQLFPNELQYTSSKSNPDTIKDLYTHKYEQIKSLPKLSGILEDDKITFYNVLRNEFNESDSPVRNALILYHIYYKGSDRLL